MFRINFNQNINIWLFAVLITSCGGSSSTNDSTVLEASNSSSVIESSEIAQATSLTTLAPRPDESEPVPLTMSPSTEAVFTEPTMQSINTPIPPDIIDLPRQADLDGDGIPDNSDDDVDGDGLDNLSDWDDDNDGIEDFLDDLRFDPTESIDYDLDGIGDNADTDDDGDGVADDVDIDPRNQLCSVAADLDAEGTCIVDLLKNSSTEMVAIDNQQIAHFAYKDVIHRLDLNSVSFLESLRSSDETNITILEYSDRDKRLYIGYASGLVEFIDDNGQRDVLVQLNQYVDAIIPAQQWTIINTWDGFSLVDVDGAIINKWAFSTKLNSHAIWNEPKSSIYFMNYGSWDSQVYSLKIQEPEIPERQWSQQVDGSFRPKSYPFAVSPEGNAIVDSKGTLYDGNSLIPSNSLPTESTHYFYIDAIWNSKHGLITQSQHGLSQGVPGTSRIIEDHAKIEQYDPTYKSFNAMFVKGTPKLLLDAGDVYYTIVERDSKLWVKKYQPEK